MDLLGRIKAVHSYSKLSGRAFAIKCGIRQQTLDNQLKEQRAISLDTVIGVCKAYPEFSRDWLLLGEGEMFKAQPKEDERISKLIDTIAMMQDAINSKADTISYLNQRIRQLEIQLGTL